MEVAAVFGSSEQLCSGEGTLAHPSVLECHPRWCRAGIYARISSDREGDGLAVGRQLEDCRALAGQRGWRVVEQYVDQDLSAYSGKTRPGYRRLLADIGAGSIDAVVVYARRTVCTGSRASWRSSSTSVRLRAERHGDGER